jgi:uncharacterized protein GlcG (DUF336 family)/mannose-6-phosphate isomerase-like protein (cupin superfamily)
MTRSILCGAIALLCAAAPGRAQVLNKPSLSLEGARRVIAGAMADARQKNAPGGVIAVVDDGGNLMALERIDGTFAAGANISIGKARTAVLFKRPTRTFEEIIKNGRTAMVALDDFTPLQGGVPIVVDGQVVGGVGVSGAASAQQDEELALAGAAALSTPSPVATSGRSGGDPVAYYAASQVSASFARGAVLVDGSGGRNYMIHTSRRDKAGQAEVHDLDADLIYVVSGHFTFVTGGTVVAPATTAPNEQRGTAIEGGETRTLAKGDVIVVPAGTPHWFKALDGPVEYYVVKVRSSADSPTAMGASR